jgi:hypothetical protein
MRKAVADRVVTMQLFLIVVSCGRRL